MKNFLLDIKLSGLELLNNTNTLIVDSLYTEKQEDETTVQIPITDIEGTNAILTTDGTSWVYTDGGWEQTDTVVDYKINNSLYPFIMSVNNSIENKFLKLGETNFYSDLTFSINLENNEFVDITGFTVQPDLTIGDFVFIRTNVSEYLTTVQNINETTMTVDGRGLNFRITGKPETCTGIFLVVFPDDYLDAVLDMLAYDFFVRDSKEKRQERLGNYTYTNFEPYQYYDGGSYPKYIQDTISYWQIIHV